MPSATTARWKSPSAAPTQVNHQVRTWDSDVAFTRRTYQHLYPEQERGGAFRLSELAGFVEQERDKIN